MIVNYSKSNNYSFFIKFLIFIFFLINLYGVAIAASFPENKPIKLLVGYAPGTAPDILARRVAQQLSSKYNIAATIENLPGAGGRIAADRLLRAPGDGHTLSVTVFGPYALLPFTEEIKDSNNFTPITLLARFDAIFAVSAKSNWNNINQLTEEVKNGRRNITIATPAVGTVVNMAAHDFRIYHQIKAEIVPYPKSSVAMIDLTEGRVDLAVTTVSVAAPLVEKGAAKIIAVTGPSRSPTFPDAPTTFEAGLANRPFASWYALFAPPSTPVEIVQSIYQTLIDLKNDQALNKTLERQGIQPVYSSPGELASQWSEDNRVWLDLIGKMKIK